ATRLVDLSEWPSLAKKSQAEGGIGSMDTSLRQRICQLIAGIVIPDEELDPREDAFVDRMLERFGLDKSERDVIFPLLDGEEAAATMRGLPREVQDEAFDLLVQAAVAD